MGSAPGTYALILQCKITDKIQIGRWKAIDIEPGYYVYVGSAFGPGGIKARVSRHCKKTKPKRWHIDYLREYVDLIEVWCSHAPERLEHQWAQIFQGMKGMTPVKGFGCSDCKCYSHLFWSEKAPDVDSFSRD
jgi:Uri superfamily endonuclease